MVRSTIQRLGAALLRSRTKVRGNDAWRIAVPLHAQSPLPWRVDLVEPARDFRRGMERRQATFVWPLVRRRDELMGHALYVVKSDRNGQTYLPDGESEFSDAEIIAR
jgi:hypothetical protein